MAADSATGGEAVYLLDYGAGNVRSVINAVRHAGCNDLRFIETVADFDKADRIIFPGVGAFGQCMGKLIELNYVEPLRKYLASGKPFLGVCIGMQTLFESSEENPEVPGLGVIPGVVERFKVDRAVPHMGWNGIRLTKPSAFFEDGTDERVYFVHSFCAQPTESNKDWVMSETDYGDFTFISAIQKGNIIATQFHPEKSGKTGLALFKRFLSLKKLDVEGGTISSVKRTTSLAPRIIACLDVRSNDAGDLVVTKGDQYDVREKSDAGDVRNLGKPVALAQQYYEDGADEITFLNITSFRSSPLQDQPMLELLRRTAENVFVPLTIGGGIRDIVEPDGTKKSALEVAGTYFRSGADKVSIGSDAVLIAEEYYKTGVKTGRSSIETISKGYGAQAVVISVDPRRVYVTSPEATPHHTIPTEFPGPNGEKFCWYECTIKGGRESRDLGAYELVRACEALGAGEILLNCIDKDGSNSGYDIELVRDIKAAVGIPVIASSGAGRPEHFKDVLEQTNADAALAAGIFHRREVPLPVVKKYLLENGVAVRPL